MARSLCAWRLQRKGLATRQSQAYPTSAGGPSPHVSPRRHHATDRVSRRWGAGVRGRIDPRIGIGAGAPACLRLQACLCPPNETCYRTPGAKRVRNFASSGGGLHVRLRHPKKKKKVESSYRASCRGQSSFPCHRMCCGPDSPVICFICLSDC